MSNTKSSRIAVVALSLAVLVVFSGFALAAAPTVDTEASDTTTESEITDGATIAYAGNSASTLQFSADSNQTAVEVYQDHGDSDYTRLSRHEANQSSTMEFVGTDAATPTLWYWNFTIDDDESGYTGIVAGPGETVDLQYRIINDTSADDPDTTNVSVDWTNHANKTFTRFDSEDVEVSSPGLWTTYTEGIPFIGSENVTEPAMAEREDVNVTGDDQGNITVHVANGTHQDALEVTQDSFTGAGVSFQGLTVVDGQLVPIVESSSDAPEWVDTDEQAFVTVSTSGDEVVVHNADDVLDSDASSIDVTAVGAESMNFGQILGMMQSHDAGWGAYVTAASNADYGAILGDQFEIEIDG